MEIMCRFIYDRLHACCIASRMNRLANVEIMSTNTIVFKVGRLARLVTRAISASIGACRVLNKEVCGTKQTFAMHVHVGTGLRSFAHKLAPNGCFYIILRCRASMANTWSIGETLAFLKAYKRQTAIWNPNDEDHKDRKKVADAWSEISVELNKPVKELKTKKEILMVTFRKHFKRKHASIRSGAGPEAIYQPRWFAYQFMESFLLPVYTSSNILKTKTQSQRNFCNIGNEPADEEMETTWLEDDPLSTPTATSSQTQSRRHTAPNVAEQQMAAAFGQLTKILGRRFQNPPTPEEDECDLYGKLLAKRLRELPRNERRMLMYEIDGLFINELNSNRETSSPEC